VRGRGSLPFALLDGEPLVSVASWQLQQAGVELLDVTEPWSGVLAREAPLVVHDPLCPATPAEFLAAAVRTAAGSGSVVVGVRPVTDTVRPVGADGVLGDVVDRGALVAVCSPVVLPPVVLGTLRRMPDTDDLAVLAESLGSRHELLLLAARAWALRIADESDLRLLEAFGPAAARRP
jgi:2-C-methyl-D-erythritol 4-phosphate cytidylyltransferase